MDKAVIAAAARAAIAPLKPSSAGTSFFAGRTSAGGRLPPYYLVFFLLVELLGFKNRGQEEKVAWSIPIEYEGTQLSIEHRKLGLGVFSDNVAADEKVAVEVVKRIVAGIKVAEPFFDHMAAEAAQSSRLNVVNNSRLLFERFEYLAGEYEKKRQEAESRKEETVRTEHSGTWGKGHSIRFPSFALQQEARWLALAAVDAFFSWTEHVFIHIGIISGRLKTGEAIANLAEANWSDKFKVALDLSNSDSKRFYDQLLVLRRQLRNFVAHGAFGKDGQAFQFHSPVGAVPLLLPHRRAGDSFKFGNGVDFVAHDAIALAHGFASHLWAGGRAPAKIYIQESGLPLVLTDAADGTYRDAMQSEEDMHEFVHHMTALADRYANMDF